MDNDFYTRMLNLKQLLVIHLVGQTRERFMGVRALVHQLIFKVIFLNRVGNINTIADLAWAAGIIDGERAVYLLTETTT